MRSIKNVFGGVVGGIILILVGIGLLWFNESNNVKNIKTVAEGRNAAININSPKIYSNNNEKLVDVSGDLNILTESTKDDVFNVGIKTAKLVRTVEMYEWDEREDNSNDNTTYSYSKKWSDELIDSSMFHQPSGHENPTSMPYESYKFLANDVNVGEFAVSEKEKDMLPTSKIISLLPTDAAIPTNYKADNQYITSSIDTQNPQVGDVRISFSYNDAKIVTILAMQNNNTFTDYKTSSGKSINMIREGKYTASEMLNYLETQNNILKWVLRAVGTLLVIFGLFALMGPITLIASFVPILGNLVRSALFVVAFLLGLAISLITISIAWIVYRPVLGILLLVGSIALFVLLSKFIKGKKTTVVVNQTMPTQPVTPVMSSTNLQPPVMNNTYVAPASNVQQPVSQQTPMYNQSNEPVQNVQNTNPQDINNNSILH